MSEYERQNEVVGVGNNGNRDIPNDDFQSDIETQKEKKEEMKPCRVHYWGGFFNGNPCSKCGWTQHNGTHLNCVICEKIKYDNYND